MLLGGHQVSDANAWQGMLKTFWDEYRLIDSQHPIFCEGNANYETCIPYMFHGDEGRGLGKRPFLVISWQPLISFRGPGYPNDSTYLDKQFAVFFL